MVIERENENYPDYLEVSEKELELISKIRQEVIKYRDNTNVLGDITDINEEAKKLLASISDSDVAIAIATAKIESVAKTRKF